MRRWADVLGDVAAPYDLKLGLEPGTRFDARPPYPDVRILDVEEVYVRRVVLQRMLVAAFTPEDDGSPKEQLEVLRLVAELEGGEELEIHRTARPLEPKEVPADKGKCAACGVAIPHGEAVETEDGAFHPRCVAEDDAPKGHVPRRRVEEA